MKHQIQREIRFLHRHTARLLVCGALSAFGGILMWVNGSSAPWVYRVTVIPSFAPGFTFCFLLWLAAYTLAGLGLGLLFLPCFPGERNGWKCSVVCFFAYILMLAWYPLFFSVLHGILAAVVLFCAAGMHIFLLIRTGRRFLTAVPVFFGCIAVELYFLIVSISYVLLN